MAGLVNETVASRLVFDTGPLTHMAIAGLLGIVKILVDGRPAILTDFVEHEVRNGLVKHPELQAVLDADWLDRHILSSEKELKCYSEFAERLVGNDGRNTGETSVLAWAKANGDALVVADDAEARKIADECNIPRIGTLGLIIEAMNDGHISKQMGSKIADEFAGSGARVPFKKGEFLTWADNAGMFYGSDS